MQILVSITNLMQNSFILIYMYYITILDMFRAILCSSSGGLNCIVTVSGIVTLCKRPCSAEFESGISPLSTGALHGRIHRRTIPDAVTIEFRPPEQHAAT
jgi:hypothetical protein